MRPAQLLLTVLLMLTFPFAADGCICGPPESPCAGLAQVDVVFVGKATRVESTGDARFSVQEVLRGRTWLPWVRVQNGGSCTFSFEEGKDYLVYAYAGRIPGLLMTTNCTRTQELQTAQADLTYLRGPAKSATTGAITGFVFRSEIDLRSGKEETSPFAGVEVKAVGEGKPHFGASDQRGRFVVPGLPPGLYSVSPTLSSELTARIEQVEVIPGGCSSAFFTVHANGLIRGTIRTPEGRPLEGIRVYSVPIELPPEEYLYVEGAHAESRSDGTYELGPLPPGRYVVGTSIKFPPSEEVPYATTFFPFGSSPQRARVIDVGFGQSREGLDFRVLGPIAVRDFPVTVASANGAPLEDFTVQVFLPDYPWFEAKYYGTMDGQSLDIPLYEGLRYWVSASGRTPADKSSCAPVVEIGRDEPVRPLKLVLSTHGWKCLEEKTEPIQTTLYDIFKRAGR